MGFIADIFTGNKAVKAQERAADKSIAASQAATDKNIALQKQMFDQVWQGTQVQRDAGDAATRMMSQIMGLNLNSAGQAQIATPAVYAAQPQPMMARNALEGIEGPYGKPIKVGRAMMSAQEVPQALAQPGAAPNALAFDATSWLRSTPGYEANFNEGSRALNAKLASRGLLGSGAAVKEATRFGQNYADRIFGDQYNRLASIAGIGQTAQSQGAQAGQNYANQSGNALMWNANNLNSSYQNKADAQSGFWGQMGGLFGSGGTANILGSFAKGLF